MAAVAFGAYTTILKFAPRWVIPIVEGSAPKLSARGQFEGDELVLSVRNDGRTDEFTAEAWLISGLADMVYNHVNVRWRHHHADKREIVSRGTQYAEVLRVSPDPGDAEAKPFIALLSPGHEQQLRPRWDGPVGEPFEVHLDVRSATSGESHRLLLTVFLAVVGRRVKSYVVTSRL